MPPPEVSKQAGHGGTCGKKGRKPVADELNAVQNAALLKAKDRVYRQTLMDIFPLRKRRDMEVFLAQASQPCSVTNPGEVPGKSLLLSFLRAVH
jgi:hypothetical protein